MSGWRDVELAGSDEELHWFTEIMGWFEPEIVGDYIANNYPVLGDSDQVFGDYVAQNYPVFGDSDEVFGDYVAQNYPILGAAEVADAAKKVVQAAAENRLPPPPMKVEPLEDDFPDEASYTFDDDADEDFPEEVFGSAEWAEIVGSRVLKGKKPLLPPGRRKGATLPQKQQVAKTHPSSKVHPLGGVIANLDLALDAIAKYHAKGDVNPEAYEMISASVKDARLYAMQGAAGRVNRQTLNSFTTKAMTVLKHYQSAGNVSGEAYDNINNALYMAFYFGAQEAGDVVLGRGEILGRTDESILSSYVRGTELTSNPFDDVSPAEVLESVEWAEIVGNDAIVGDAYWAEVVGASFPKLQGFYERFVAATPDPKLVRLDTEETYEDLVGARGAKYKDALERRLAELEVAYREHVSDGHGGAFSGVSEKLEAIVGEVARLATAAKKGGEPVPLSLPPWMEGAVECVQDGDEIRCSMRLPGPDGRVRIATTGTSAAKAVEDVVGYVEDAGVHPAEVLGVLLSLAQMLGGGGLIPQLAQVAPSLISQAEVLGQDRPLFAKMKSASDPTLASLMALYQSCQQGDRQACDELARLAAVASTSGGEALAGHLADAKTRLQWAQTLAASEVI